MFTFKVNLLTYDVYCVHTVHFRVVWWRSIKKCIFQGLPDCFRTSIPKSHFYKLHFRALPLCLWYWEHCLKSLSDIDEMYKNHIANMMLYATKTYEKDKKLMKKPRISFIKKTVHLTVWNMQGQHLKIAGGMKFDLFFVLTKKEQKLSKHLLDSVPASPNFVHFQGLKWNKIK